MIDQDSELGHLIYLEKKSLISISYFNCFMSSSINKEFDKIEKLKGWFSDLE